MKVSIKRITGLFATGFIIGLTKPTGWFAFPRQGRLRQRFALKMFLLSVAFMVPSVSLAVPAQGVALANNLSGTFGTVTGSMRTEIDKLLNESGLKDAATESQSALNQLAQGKIPVISDLSEPYQADVDAAIGSALTKAQIATRILNKVGGSAAQKALRFIADSPLFVDTDIGITLPYGRLRIYHKNLDVSICMTTVGPAGFISITGISNGEYLCQNKSPRMSNPSRALLMFTDMAVGYSHLRVNQFLAPSLSGDLTQLPPALEAETYVTINGQRIQLRLAGADPQSIKVGAKLAVGLKGGVNYEVKAEVKGEAAIKVDLKPLYAAEVIKGATNAMLAKASTIGIADLKTGGNPTEVADIIKAGLDYLNTAQATYESEDGFGETSLTIGINGGLGVGIWDTGIDLASVSEETALKLPLDSVVVMATSVLEQFLDFGLAMTDANMNLTTRILEVNDNTDTALQDFSVKARAESKLLVEGLLSDVLAVTSDVKLESEFVIAILGTANSESIPIYKTGLKMPIGQMAVNLVTHPEAIGDAAIAAGYLMLAGINKDATIDKTIWTDLSQGLALFPDITFDYLSIPPPVPPVYAIGALVGLKDISLFKTLSMLSQEIQSMRDILVSVRQGAAAGSLDPLRTAIENSLAVQEQLTLDVINRSTLAFSMGLGANADLGAEVVLKLGAGFNLEGEIKTSVLLLLLDNPAYQEPDLSVLSKVSLPVKATLGLGASIGEGVELTVDGSGTVSSDLFKWTATQWDGPLPSPISMRVAGFPVLEFDGVVNNDGSFSGSGFLMLPMGGIVAADFSVDANDNVLSGTWSGGIDLGPLGKYTLLSGSLDNDGLHGVVNTNILGSPLNANFILASSGMLYGSYSGALVIGGYQLAGVDLYLGPNGDYSGQFIGAIDIGGLNADTNLTVANEGFSGSGTLHILGSDLNATDLEISRSGYLSGTFSGDIQAGPYTLSSVSLQAINGGLAGTAVMDLPGVAQARVDLQIYNGEVTATYAGDLMGGLSTHTGMIISNSGVSLSALLKQDQLNSIGSQVIALITATAQQAQSLLPDAQLVLAAKQTAEQTALTALNNIQGDIDALKASYQTQIDTAQAALSTAQAAVTTAQNAVNSWYSKIRSLDNWYNGLSSFQKTVQWAYYQTTRTAYVVSLNAAKAALSVAQTTLAGAQAVLVAIEAELDQQIQNLKGALQTAYDTAKAELDAATAYVNELISKISVLNIDPASLLSIHSAFFKADLGQLLSGTSFNVIVNMTFMGEQGRISFNFNPADPVGSFHQLVQSLLLGTVQLLNNDNVVPRVYSGLGLAQQAVKDAEQAVQDAQDAIDNATATDVAQITADYEFQINDAQFAVYDAQAAIDQAQTAIDDYLAANPGQTSTAEYLQLVQALHNAQKTAADANMYLVYITNKRDQAIAVVMQPLQDAYDAAVAKLTDAQDHLQGFGILAADWQTGAIMIQIKADDNAKGSGVASITYSAGGGQTIAATTVAGDVVSVPIKFEGVTSLKYFATDISGNVGDTTTMTISIDRSDPQITVVTPGDPDSNPYQVKVSAKDLQGSGIAYLLISAYGAETVNEYKVSADTAVVTLTEPGVTSLSVTAVDVAGNKAIFTQDVTVPVAIVNANGSFNNDSGGSSGGGSLSLLCLLFVLITLWFGKMHRSRAGFARMRRTNLE